MVNVDFDDDDDWRGWRSTNAYGELKNFIGWYCGGDGECDVRC